MPLDKRYVMLIEALAGTTKDLRRLIRPVADNDAARKQAIHDWCIKDVIAHLADIEPQFRSRFTRIVEQDNPSEPFISPHPERHDLDAPTAALIDAFAAERAQTTAWLGALTQAQWLRSCTHETFGITRLRQQAEILIGHDNEHLAQIVSIREWLAKKPPAG
jgi:uncharacterized damage-inducible protein DinB